MYGESYFLDANGRINQRNCSPLDYLNRLRLWGKLFDTRPIDLGITEAGQIISQYLFVKGVEPTQELVDELLYSIGLTPVRQKFWRWERVWPQYEIWLGDARCDNFISTQNGIVPIDVRLWFYGEMPDELRGR